MKDGDHESDSETEAYSDNEVITDLETTAGPPTVEEIATLTDGDFELVPDFLWLGMKEEVDSCAQVKE